MLEPNQTLLFLSPDLFLGTQLEGLARGVGLTWRQSQPADWTDQLDNGEVWLAIVDLQAVRRDQLSALISGLQEYAIPTIAFGPHVQEELLDFAREVGFDSVVTRGAVVGEVRSAIDDAWRE